VAGVVEEETNYATCVNAECQWNGFSFAPPPDAKGTRRCPSCGEELKNWKASSERKKLEGERDSG
jgi:hypothetical protein